MVGDSGGQGALAADAFAAQGLDVPAFTEGTRDAVAEQLPRGAGCGNPVDLAGAGEADLGNYARVADTLLHSGDTDTVVLTGYFGDYATANPAQRDRECEVANALADAAVASGRALVVHTMARDTPALTVLRQRGVPVYERIEQAATAVAAAARLTDPALTREEPCGPGDVQADGRRLRERAGAARFLSTRLSCGRVRDRRGRGRGGGGAPDGVSARPQGDGARAQDRGRMGSPCRSPTPTPCAPPTPG